jgi:hypothetical protein
LRARFGAAGRAHVESRYAMRNYRIHYLELLSRLAAAPAPDRKGMQRI